MLEMGTDATNGNAGDYTWSLERALTNPESQLSPQLDQQTGAEMPVSTQQSLG